jgi:hypothetical protein
MVMEQKILHHQDTKATKGTKEILVSLGVLGALVVDLSIFR